MNGIFHPDRILAQDSYISRNKKGTEAVNVARRFTVIV